MEEGGGDKLSPGQRRALIGGGELIGGEPPAAIPRLAKDARFMPGENGVKPLRRAMGIDRGRPFEHRSKGRAPIQLCDFIGGGERLG